MDALSLHYIKLKKKKKKKKKEEYILVGKGSLKVWSAYFLHFLQIYLTSNVVVIFIAVVTAFIGMPNIMEFILFSF